MYRGPPMSSRIPARFSASIAGDDVDGLAPGVEPAQDLVDPAVGGAVEVVGLQDLDDVGDGLGREHHGAEDRTPRPRRSAEGPAGRSWRCAARLRHARHDPHPSPTIAPRNGPMHRAPRTEATLRPGKFHWISGVDCCAAGRGERFLVTPALTCAFPMWTTMWTSVNHTSDIPGGDREGPATRTLYLWRYARTGPSPLSAELGCRSDARPRASHADPHARAAPAGAALRLGAREATRDQVRERAIPSPAAGQGRAWRSAAGDRRVRGGLELLFTATAGVWIDIESDGAGSDRGAMHRAYVGGARPATARRRDGAATRATPRSTSCRSGKSG